MMMSEGGLINHTIYLSFRWYFFCFR